MTMTTRDNFSLSAAVLGEGTAANTFAIGAITHYSIDGRAYRKAVTDDIAFAVATGTTHTALAANQVCVFFILINAAGTVTALQSEIKPASTAAAYEPGAFGWPDRELVACIGAIRVQTGATTFTAGSTDLGAASVTDTYFNVAVDYGKPITY
jgi:hypothetical protein